MNSCSKIILWTGPKHSGKTTAAFKLIEKAKANDFQVTGIVAPSVYDQGKLVGFEISDIRSGKRALLVRRIKKNSPFLFTTKGFRFGGKILSAKSTAAASLIIIDEFGPLELAGKGWRKYIDKLSATPALLLLVVRKELIKKVKRLYENLSAQQLNALDNNSFKKVMIMLKYNKMVLNELKKNSKNRHISCASCFKIADKLKVPLKTIGRLCNENKIRISYCQLGCFK